jgi:hypothetical protein
MYRGSTPTIWFACGIVDGGLLRHGKPQPEMDTGICSDVRTGFRLWLPPGSLAFRPGGSSMESGRRAALVVETRLTKRIDRSIGINAGVEMFS